MIESITNAKQMWDCFHDGAIVRVTKSVEQQYTLEIEILYLMEEVTGKEEGVFQVILEGCKKIEYEPYESSANSDIPFDSEIRIGILSSEAKDNQLVIYCSYYQDQTKSFEAGVVHLEYKSCKVFLMSTEITLTQLNDAQQSYWNKFGN
jgi:hypothetical protein